MLDHFRQPGLAELRTEAQAAFVPLTDPRAATMLDLFARVGAAVDAERFGAMPAAEYTSLLAVVERAHHDPATTQASPRDERPSKQICETLGVLLGLPVSV